MRYSASEPCFRNRVLDLVRGRSERRRMVAKNVERKLERLFREIDGNAPALADALVLAIHCDLSWERVASVLGATRPTVNADDYRQLLLQLIARLWRSESKQRGKRSIVPDVRVRSDAPCSLRRHCRGALREVVGLAEKFAANDEEGFVWLGASFFRHARNHNTGEQ
jgi:hypothetical protein